MTKTPDLEFDVFLNHSAADTVTAQTIADGLRADGLSVWFDGDIDLDGGVQTNIEHALETSRIQLLCMSANAFGSDWTRLESRTFPVS